MTDGASATAICVFWVISVSVLVYGAGTYYEYETKSEDMCGGSGYP